MNLKTQINNLLRKINKATAIYSFFIDDQPQLLEIIALGDDAIPYLLDHLREYQIAHATDYKNHNFDDFCPWYAIIALGQITKANPIAPDHAGRLTHIINDWLAWKPGDTDVNGDLTYWPVDE